MSRRVRGCWSARDLDLQNCENRCVREPHWKVRLGFVEDSSRLKARPCSATL